MRSRPAAGLGPSLRGIAAAAVLAVAGTALFAQPVDPALYADMKWRLIGPFRGGRTVGAGGVAGKPNVFYIGVNNGGVWKTTDYGRTWTPIFDDQPTRSIGAIAVAPSEPERHLRRQRRGPAAARPLGRRRHLQVDRRREDAGSTSACATGSRSRRSSSIRRTRTACSSPCSAIRTAPNAERGVFRSTDGGANVREGPLQGREHRRDRPRVRSVESAHRLRGALGGAAGAVGERQRVRRARQRPLQVDRRRRRPGSRSASGLPTPADGLGRIGIGIAPSDRQAHLRARSSAGSRPASTAPTTPARAGARVQRRETASAGAATTSPSVRVDPKNPDVVYAANIVTYRSTDGGETFTAFKGAPGGDDYHTIWINPRRPGRHPDRRRPGRDDHGQRRRAPGAPGTTSRPAQMFHVTADNRFPVPGLRRPAGDAARRASRAAATTARSRSATGIRSASRSTATPRPIRSHPDIVYGGKVTRFDETTGDDAERRTGRAARPASTDSSARRRSSSRRSIRTSSTSRLNVLCKTTNGGQTLGRRSAPTSSRENPGVPASVGIYAQRRGEGRAPRRHLRDRAVAARRRTRSGPAPTTARSR